MVEGVPPLNGNIVWTQGDGGIFSHIARIFEIRLDGGAIFWLAVWTVSSL